MNKKYILPLGLAILGIYLLMKSKKQARVIPINPMVEPQEPTKKTQSKPSSTTTSSSVSLGEDISEYVVSTTSGNLNLRQFPSTTSKIITSYPKGTVLKARDSSIVPGWAEVVEGASFPRVIGYVSSKYLTPKG